MINSISSHLDPGQQPASDGRAAPRRLPPVQRTLRLHHRRRQQQESLPVQQIHRPLQPPRPPVHRRSPVTSDIPVHLNLVSVGPHAGPVVSGTRSPVCRVPAGPGDGRGAGGHLVGCRSAEHFRGCQ